MSHWKNEGIQIIIKKMHINESYVLQYLQHFMKNFCYFEHKFCKTSLVDHIRAEEKM